MQRQVSTTARCWQSRAYPASSIPTPTLSSWTSEVEARAPFAPVTCDPPFPRGAWWCPRFPEVGLVELEPGDHVEVVGGQQVGKQEPKSGGSQEEDISPGLLCHPQLHHDREVKDEEVELQEVRCSEGEPAGQAHVWPESSLRQNKQVPFKCHQYSGVLDTAWNFGVKSFRLKKAKGCQKR